MVNQNKMNEWITETIAHFKEIMPAIDIQYPEICILNDDDELDVRNSIVERIQSPQKRIMIPCPMEAIHGSLGDAIIIYQKYGTNKKTALKDDKAEFQHLLLHELGRFFAINMECPGENLFRYIDQKLHFDDFSSQLGYWFWNEFIAEVIACHCDPDTDIDWASSDWEPVKTELSTLLCSTFSNYEDFIDQYALARYYAKLLTGKTVTSFLEAVNSGILTVKTTVNGKEKTVPFDKAGIDPTFKSAVPTFYHRLLNEMQKILEVQVSKELYWETDLEFVTKLGYIIEDLRNIKLMHSSQDTFGQLLQKLSGASDND